MDRRKSKRERVRTLFAETAKEIIRREGVEVITVRRVAEEAGYTFASIYNNFENIDELLQYSRELIVRDLAVHIGAEEKKLGEKKAGKELLAALFKCYIAYFLENPTIFRFFFFYPHPPRSESIPDHTKEAAFTDAFTQSFSFISDAWGFSEEELSLLSRSLIYTIHGMLTLSMAGYEEMKQSTADTFLDELLTFLEKVSKNRTNN